ncbi:MAG TPA: hypothetical protein VHN14_23810 [Kofleriaceae bacterium]|jgi:hypothetical protein|nr:hypothetical protein [Kofleriaceae bacterium]
MQGEISVAGGAPSSLPANVTVISIHPMYSAGQVCLATFIGGPLGGGWLMALNYKRLGQPGKARVAVGLNVLAIVALTAIGFATPGWSMSGLAIGSIFGMRALAKSLQGAAYDRHVQAGGSRGSSWRAAGIGLASFPICFGVASICVGVMIGPAVMHEFTTARDRVVVGDSEVRYTAGATRAEAQSVGDALVELGYLGAGRRSSVQVTRDHDRHVVELVVQDRAFSDDQIQRQLHELADPLSRKAFAGAPVDLWLTDNELEPRAKLTWETR